MKYYSLHSWLYMAILCVTLGTGCTNKNTSQDTIYVNVDVTQQSPLTDFICGERHICLETNDSCLMSGIGCLAVIGEDVIVEDNGNVYRFDHAGKLISSFNHRGPGPGEYTGVNRLHVFDGYIYILDRNLKKIFKYSVAGDFLQDFKLDYDYLDFNIISKDRFVLASGNFNESMAEFVIINPNTGELISKICDYGIDQTFLMTDYTPFSGAKDGELYVNVPFSHNTFRLAEHKLDTIASYHFNTTDQLPEFTMQDMDIMQLWRGTLYKNVVRQLGYYCPVEKCSYLTFMLFGEYGLSQHLLKFDHDGSCIAQTTINIEDNTDYPYFTNIRRFINGEIVVTCSSDQLLDIDERINSTYWEDHGLTENSNPVIFFYKLKDI